ncbi:MAG: bifunctional DNA-binding transcriptional regulator/O6-methylguanine-DNA methyltransferase Ada [Chloroflexi bacterium]|nr:bifunctional DNA-binding transcriptional regulator/O6-methylguanine-DNA methyltransferase Ada [Chloroflexota bacterium]
MNEDQRWQAVLQRDREADGAFVYAVRSTGIYCRPSCPSRRPQRAQVVFYERPAAAEQAGFRACRRCQPRQIAPSAPEPEWVRAACDYIEAHPGEPLTLDTLSARVHVSPYHLQRTFKRVTGVTPRQYAEARRLERLKTGLKNGGTVTGALYEAGYGSSSRLYERSADQLGMTPAAYRKGGLGMQIHYTLAACRLGRLLVAATEKGLCAVSLGDADAALEAALRQEYPAADLRRADAALGEWVHALTDYLSGQPLRGDLPLDVQATAFQRQVWDALRAIPYGQTRTYSQIALSLGNPKATRAVGHACASNPVSLVIPCHRAVRADGGLGGYRWGLERKRRLLETEAPKG